MAGGRGQSVSTAASWALLALPIRRGWRSLPRLLQAPLPSLAAALGRESSPGGRAGWNHVAEPAVSPQEETFPRLLSASQAGGTVPSRHLSLSAVPEWPPEPSGWSRSGPGSLWACVLRCSHLHSCVPEAKLCLALRAAASRPPPTLQVYPFLILAVFLLHSLSGVGGLVEVDRLNSWAVLQPYAHQQPWRRATSARQGLSGTFHKATRSLKSSDLSDLSPLDA